MSITAPRESIASSPSKKSPPTFKFEPIAIVGVGMRAPGNIDGLASLWDAVIQRKSFHGCLATDSRFLRRFDPEAFRAMFSAFPDGKTTLHANLLDETPGLDEAYFGVSKRDSACMDAQLKLLLHVAHEALEDAGFSGAQDGSAMDPATFGVYVAASTDDIQQDPENYNVDIYHMVRTPRSFLAGQLSHHFGLHGPAVLIDTLCAGSVTAFNDACRALMSGECRAAIAGGVHVMSPVSGPAVTMGLKLAGFLDPTGQCKPFLANGAGYCRAEGCGLAVLKRLSDAIHDGDHIHGVIQGMGVGNMAAAKSIVRPDGLLQSHTLAKAVASSGIDPADISFIEAHGPGTQQGDLAELCSICSAIAKEGSRKQHSPIIIGSIKGNVGHSEPASGAISLFKVLAMMRYQRIPPQANFHMSKLNPRLKPFLEKHPIRISDSEQEWRVSRRIAVVSNFGATGYSGHMVVVEPPSLSVPSADSLRLHGSLPFVISAKDPSALLAAARRYADWLDSDGSSESFSNISYSTTTRRILHPHLAVLQARSHVELACQLRSDSLPIVSSSSQRPRTIAFCFAGQGGPRLDPRLSSFYGVSATFTSTVDACFRLSETEQLIAPDDIEALELFALQAGLAEMWTSWGVTPVALAGHSFGEYAALLRAGVLSLRDALMLVGIRASLVRQTCVVPPSKMAALLLPLSEVYELLEKQETTRVELACINSEDRVTLAGTYEDLSTFHEELLRAHPTARWQLVDNVKTGFHSRFVEPLRRQFLEACKNINFSPQKTTVLSGPLGRTLLPGDDTLLQPDYLFRHCRETNKFGKAILDFKGRSEVAGTYQPDWIELGPHSTTIGFIPLTSEQLKLSSHYKGASGWTTTLNTLVALRTAGHAIDFVAFHRDVNPTARHIELPRYPFQLQPHIYSGKRGRHVSPGFSNPIMYPRIKSMDIAPLMKGHLVVNQPICPASIYMALVLSTSFDSHKERQAFRISRFTMTAPFTSLTDDWLQARATLSSPKATPSTFDVISKSGQVHASMQVDICGESALLDTLCLLKPLVLSLGCIKNNSGTKVLGTRPVYDLFNQTICYASHCQGLGRVWISEDGHQVCALSSNTLEEVAHRRGLEPSSLREYSPILIDRVCQLVGFMINVSPARAHDEIFVDSEIDQVEIAWSMVKESVSFESYASFELADRNNVAVGQVFTFDHEQRLVAAFRGVRMRRLKRQIVERTVQLASGESEASSPSSAPAVVQGLPTPILTPKEEDGNVSLNDLMRNKVSAIIQSKLGGQPIQSERKLADLGMDSLTAVEINVEIGRLIPEHKLPSELLAHPDTTLNVLFDALRLSSGSQRTLDLNAIAHKLSLSAAKLEGDRRTSEDAALPSHHAEGVMTVLDDMGDNPELIQDKPGTVPLILIHDGGGTAVAYRSLGDVGHTVLGIYNPRIRDGKGIVSIRHAADEYAALACRWLEEASHLPARILVGGLSLGGLIALSLAASYPDLVSGVILVDAPPPGMTPMAPEEAENLIPNAVARSSSGFGTLIRNQLKMNSRALSADTDFQGGYRSLTARLTAPVYLISASEPLSIPNATETKNSTPGSCSAWMMARDRAGLAESAWKECLGNVLVGSQRSPGDPFTLFTPIHISSTTRAVRQAARALTASVANGVEIN